MRRNRARANAIFVRESARQHVGIVMRQRIGAAPMHELRIAADVAAKAPRLFFAVRAGKNEHRNCGGRHYRIHLRERRAPGRTEIVDVERIAVGANFDTPPIVVGGRSHADVTASRQPRHQSAASTEPRHRFAEVRHSNTPERGSQPETGTQAAQCSPRRKRHLPRAASMPPLPIACAERISAALRGVQHERDLPACGGVVDRRERSAGLSQQFRRNRTAERVMRRSDEIERGVRPVEAAVTTRPTSANAPAHATIGEAGMALPVFDSL